jgi:BirA family biotin operon repressor/biotin-[acetyl-CoA-carboxylase] ligase
VQLKWPNDLVASEGKLGGILTEVQPQQSEAVTVVVGIGINVDIGDVSDLFDQSAWALRTIDLRRICLKLPSHDAVAGALISELAAAVIKFEVSGFASFTSSWSDHDWLSGREVTLEINNKQVSRIATGSEEDGALLVATDNDGIRRVTSGSIVSVGPIGTAT